ncbi:MAG: PLP-dependent cysteine synthase family protein, partial [Pseudomonadales bacterium]|nr:PLP-dependent cysteine synthase family protein [Pseudomonadales bacterium]
VMHVAQNMRTQGLKGSIVTLLCDSGDRYLNTYHNANWVAKHIGDPRIYQQKLEEIFQ